MNILNIEESPVPFFDLEIEHKLHLVMKDLVKEEGVRVCS